MKKLWDLKKVFSNLELEGQGRGIIMGVARLLLLGPFYTIQTKKDQTFWRGVYELTTNLNQIFAILAENQTKPKLIHVKLVHMLIEVIKRWQHHHKKRAEKYTHNQIFLLWHKAYLSITFRLANSGPNSFGMSVLFPFLTIVASSRLKELLSESTGQQQPDMQDVTVYILGQ